MVNYTLIRRFGFIEKIGKKFFADMDLLTASAIPVDRAVAGNRPQPGHRAGAGWVIRRGRAPDLKEYILQQVFGRAAVGGDPQADGEQFFRSRMIDPAKCLAIAVTYASKVLR